jgi:hypothetical protein
MLTQHDNISRETVRRRLGENEIKPRRKGMWCIPQVDGEFVARVEDVLNLCAEEPERKRPVVCFAESPTNSSARSVIRIKAKPRQPERYDCEYKRNDTANLFISSACIGPGAGSKSPTAARRRLRCLHAGTRGRALSQDGVHPRRAG